MAILFYSEMDAPEPWREALARELPDMELRVWPDVRTVEDIHYALVWKPPPGLLGGLPRLKAMFSLGAGVDGILLDPALPTHVPLTRMVDAGLAGQMSEYALYATLHFHRCMDRYSQQQRREQWGPLPAVPAAERVVGVMGLGVLGGDFARKAAALGFRVLGWSRSAHQLDGVTVFEGDGAFEPFLRHTHILLNFLPLTSQTAGILNARTFASLPRGACIVNIARGGHVVEADLLAALDQGQLGGAMLDVFATEPLPADHPFWRHPSVIVTPHIAAQAIAKLMIEQVVENIRRVERGEAPLGLVDARRGY